MEQNLLQLGGIAALFALMIRELFAYLKTKKNGTGYVDAAILKELQTMNGNHLHSLENAINDGNYKVVEAINNGNMKMVELLGRIEGKLDK